MKHIIISFGVVLLFSCVNKEQKAHNFSTEQIASLQLDSTTVLSVEADQSEIVDLNPFLKEQRFDFDSIIKEIKIVPLETTDESLLDEINKIIVSDSHIYIADRFKGGGIVIFNREGRFVRRIPFGQGPGELSRFLGMDYDKKNNMLIVYQHPFFLFYSSEGDFIRNERLPFGFFDFAVTSEGYLFKTLDNQGNWHLGKYQNYTLLVTDKKFRIKSVGIHQLPKGEVLGFKHNLYKNNYDIKITHYYVDTIFQYLPTLNTLRAAYVLDYSDKKLPDSFVGGTNEVFKKATRNNNYYYNIGEYLETASHHIFYLMNSYIGHQTTIYRDKQTGHLSGGTIARVNTNEIPHIAFPIAATDDYFIAVHIPEKKDTLLTKSLFMRDKDKKIILNMQEDDNPALIFFRLKGF